MSDVMEREPHKRPDDDLARINKIHLPKLDAVIAQVDGMGEHSYSDIDTIHLYAQYREAYAEALQEHYHRFEANPALPPEHPDRDNDAQNFVDQLIELNEDERIGHYVEERTKTMDAAHAEEFKFRLPMHFGTMRNQYLQSMFEAGTQVSDFLNQGPVVDPGKKGPGKG